MKTLNKNKIDKSNWPIIAICYDFDKTLSPRDMQDFALLPKLECVPSEFWAESNMFAKENGVDKILAYMQLIISKAKAKGIRITKDDFKDMGKNIELFSGVETWFDRINRFADSLQINVEHYIISAGLKEIIEGSSIASKFTHVYASSFIYDEYGRPTWPRQVVNYTTKTQYLFRISKNCLDLSDEDTINNYVPDNQRRIHFRNFIYIGDSETDIPAMKIIKNGGGTSIGVYKVENSNLDRVRGLLRQQRIDYFVPADYSEGSRIENIVKDIIRKIGANEILIKLNKQQDEYINELERAEYFYEYTQDFLNDNYLGLDELKFTKKQAMEILRKFKKNLCKFVDIVPSEVNDQFIVDLKQKIQDLFLAEKKAIMKENEVSEVKRLERGKSNEN